MRMMAILTTNKERPFVGIEEIPKDVSPGEVFQNWKNSLDEDAREFIVGTLKPNYIFIHPVCGTILRDAPLELAMISDSAGDQQNNNMAVLCKEMEVSADFAIPKEEFIESMKVFGRTNTAEDLDVIQWAKENCQIEAKTISEALANGWEIPSLEYLWDRMNDCMSEEGRASDAIGDLLELAYPTAGRKWGYLVEGGWVFENAVGFLDKGDSQD